MLDASSTNSEIGKRFILNMLIENQNAVEKIGNNFVLKKNVFSNSAASNNVYNFT
jgi:hypothetical protein